MVYCDFQTPQQNQYKLFQKVLNYQCDTNNILLQISPTMWHLYNNMPENPRFWCQLIYRDKYHHALSSRHIRKVHSSMPAPTQPTNPNIWLVIFMLSKKMVCSFSFKFSEHFVKCKIFQCNENSFRKLLLERWSILCKVL